MFAPAPRGNRLDAPAWTREPPAAAVDRVRPRIAWALGSPGAARLRCRVARTGRVDDCDVEAELPLGLGFGAAAQRLTAFYRLSEEEAARSRGRAVTLRVKFPPPPVEAPFEAPPAPSAKRLELARRLVDEQAVAAGRRAFEFEILELTSRPPRGTDPKVLDAALEAYRAGANKAISRMVDQFVAVHAAALNEGELEALAAYQKSPAAVAQTERLRPLAVELGKAARYGLARIQDDARARFCKTVDCVVAPPAPAPAPPSPTSGNSGR